MSRIALIAPTLRGARGAARALSPLREKVEPFSLDSFLAARRAPLLVALSLVGCSLAEARDFARRVGRRILWPAPAERLSGAIAGFLGEHDAAGGGREAPHRSGHESALLLEGTVTFTRAKRALSRAELSRDWIVEHPRRARLSDDELTELARKRVRWFALTPVSLAAVVVDEALAREPARFMRLVPSGTPLWKLAGPESLRRRWSRIPPARQTPGFPLGGRRQ